MKSRELELSEDIFDKSGWGWDNFLPRQRVIDEFLDAKGALSIHVDIQVVKKRPAIWEPSKRFETKIRRLCNSKDGADVEFLVQGSTGCISEPYLCVPFTCTVLVSAP